MHLLPLMLHMFTEKGLCQTVLHMLDLGVEVINRLSDLLAR